MCGLISDLVIWSLEKVWPYMTPNAFTEPGFIKQHKLNPPLVLHYAIHWDYLYGHYSLAYRSYISWHWIMDRFACLCPYNWHVVALIFPLSTVIHTMLWLTMVGVMAAGWGTGEGRLWRVCVVLRHLVPVRTFGVMYDHTYLNLQITRSDIRLHIKWAVSLVIAYGHFTI